MNDSQRIINILEALERMRDEARDKARQTNTMQDQIRWEALSDALSVVASL